MHTHFDTNSGEVFFLFWSTKVVVLFDTSFNTPIRVVQLDHPVGNWYVVWEATLQSSSCKPMASFHLLSSTSPHFTTMTYVDVKA